MAAGIWLGRCWGVGCCAGGMRSIGLFGIGCGWGGGRRRGGAGGVGGVVGGEEEGGGRRRRVLREGGGGGGEGGGGGGGRRMVRREGGGGWEEGRGRRREGGWAVEGGSTTGDGSPDCGSCLPRQPLPRTLPPTGNGVGRKCMWRSGAWAG